jgi:hypothetical protein
VLDKLKTTDGDYMELFQRFCGDGYMTRFVQTNKEGRSWIFIIDGDAYKAWNGKIKKTNNVVEVSIFHEHFFYNLQSHVITDTTGKPQLILEKPEDGSPAFFLGKKTGTEERNGKTQ